ncbi:MAG TPA: hypothetical protein VD902_04825 [Symbiobacteriaceae bacterium]|nr:hypothetical protein [Symbiobacteriaceae bacterium]
MAHDREQSPVSPTALGLGTGMPVPGLADVRGTLEEALVFPPEGRGGAPQSRAELDVIPGQSGAEGLADLPRTRPG